MAYYSYPYSGSDYGEYNFNSDAVNYDYARIPTHMAYNGYDYSKPYCVYDPNPSLYFSPNYPVHSYQTLSYSATAYTDPKSFEYDPNYGMTQLVISYSKVEEFNEPAYDEYDPTPYGGGYDIAETYGKSLPPSDEICYPPIKSSSISPPFAAVPSGAIVPLPTVEEEEGIDEKAIKPQNEIGGQIAQEKPPSQDSSKDQPREAEDSNYDTLDLEPNEGEGSEGSHHEDDHYSGSGYGNGYSGEQQYQEYEKQVPPQYPSGYGLEAMDLCESLFGYWPCLSRMKKREQHCCEEEVSGRGNYCRENMWQGTADYLFGNPNPYGGRGEDGNNYGHGGEIVYGYERHYPTQSQYRQIEYADESWG